MRLPCSGLKKYLRGQLKIAFLFLLSAAICCPQTVGNSAYYQELTQRVFADPSSFYIYRDQDSGFNHGFPSGLFPANESQNIQLNAGCIDDTASPDGCSSDPTQLDLTRGTVLQISFSNIAVNDFAGVNIEEPQDWGVLRTGIGYNLQGSSNLVLDARSPDSAQVQFGMDGCVSPPYNLTPTWQTIVIPLNSLSCFSDLSNVHILFAVSVSNSSSQPLSAIVLLDNIYYDPPPTSQASAISFPLSTQTFGVIPTQTPVPSDVILRNLTTTYESALTLISLLSRGQAQDNQGALLIANAFDYALGHDNHGDPLPTGPGPVDGLHNGYEAGDLPLYNNQTPPAAGQAGDVRLAGFTTLTSNCGSSGFCLVEDGATGGNNAFAILALIRAYNYFGNIQYLNDAREIGSWIVAMLADTSATGFGGYFAGYPDMGAPKVLETGKSTENNADIFSAFSALARATAALGYAGEANAWTAAANSAGDFVMQMFDSTNQRFNSGTVPSGTAPNPASGSCPSTLTKGNDTISTCDFLDANTFTTLAIAASPRYLNQIDWRGPVQYAWTHFFQSVTAGGYTFNGFDLVSTPTSGPNGVAWEFTGQMCEAMQYVGQLYGDSSFDSDVAQCLSWLQQAQLSAPYGDQEGLVASTMQGGDTIPPAQQCLNTPFQCIPERVGLAATNWAIFANAAFNPFPASIAALIPGNLARISVGADGSIWGINSSGAIYQWDSQLQSWQSVPGWLSQIAVGASGYVWGLNPAGEIYRFDSNTQNWDPIPGSLSQIAVGADGDVWGINGANQIYHFDATIQNWDYVPGTLTQLAVGYDAAIWGLDASGNIYRFNIGTQAFDQVAGSLQQISVGADGDVWGVNAANQIYHFNTLLQNWEQIAGSLSQISVGSATNVWGINASGSVYAFNTSSQTWTAAGEELSRISAGENGAAWGLDSTGSIYQLAQTVQPTEAWHPLPGTLSQLVVGADNNAWGLDASGAVYHFNSLLQNWQAVPGSLSQIAVGFEGNVWGINSAGFIFRFNPTTQNWDNVPGQLAQIAVGANGAVWGINSASDIYRFDSAAQTWQWIPGALTQLSVGADGSVWGLNGSGQIWRFDPQIQGWDSIPGWLSQIAVGSSNTVWGLNPAGDIYQFDSQTQNWNWVPGILSQIAVAFDGTVWGINSADQIFRFDPLAQTWDSIFGSLSQMSVGADAAVWGVNAAQAVYRFW